MAVGFAIPKIPVNFSITFFSVCYYTFSYEQTALSILLMHTVFLIFDATLWFEFIFYCFNYQSVYSNFSIWLALSLPVLSTLSGLCLEIIVSQSAHNRLVSSPHYSWACGFCFISYYLTVCFVKWCLNIWIGFLLMASFLFACTKWMEHVHFIKIDDIKREYFNYVHELTTAGAKRFGIKEIIFMGTLPNDIEEFNWLHKMVYDSPVGSRGGLLNLIIEIKSSRHCFHRNLKMDPFSIHITNKSLQLSCDFDVFKKYQLTELLEIVLHFKKIQTYYFIKELNIYGLHPIDLFEIKKYLPLEELKKVKKKFLPLEVKEWFPKTINRYLYIQIEAKNTFTKFQTIDDLKKINVFTKIGLCAQPKNIKKSLRKGAYF
jgi:hypothetical protein